LFVGNVASYLNFPDRMVLAQPLSELARFLVFFLSLALKQIEATCVQNGPVEFEKKNTKNIYSLKNGNFVVRGLRRSHRRSGNNSKHSHIELLRKIPNLFIFCTSQ